MNPYETFSQKFVFVSSFSSYGLWFRSSRQVLFVSGFGSFGFGWFKFQHLQINCIYSMLFFLYTEYQVVARTSVCQLIAIMRISLFSWFGLIKDLIFWETGLVIHFVSWKLLKQLLEKPQMRKYILHHAIKLITLGI